MRSLVPILLVFAVACTAKDSGTAARTDTTSATTASSTETAISSTETAVAPEVNPPGDIPDSQAFVKYSNSSGGYQLQVPEGWSQQAGPPEYSSDVTFVHNYNGVSVHVAPASAPPTAASVQANEVKQIQSRARAVTVNKVSEVNLPGGKAVLVSYTSNSAPNPVTNKQVRLENQTYIFYRNGKEAMLTLWAPLGADNVDQWKLMADSFRWL
ncbi:MAG TPA: hypothetical protein VGO33_06855 [Gemmatimonadaceae bacterium]|jgi:hypothetical protein|nr:hypothetical protein [Gemmatimonadaceae bacterium]